MEDTKSKEALYEEARLIHQSLDEKLVVLENKPFLTGEEEIEVKLLKKKKLYYKDIMENIGQEIRTK